LYALVVLLDELIGVLGGVVYGIDGVFVAHQHLLDGAHDDVNDIEVRAKEGA